MNKLTDEIDDMNYLLFQSKYWSHVHIVIIYLFIYFLVYVICLFWCTNFEPYMIKIVVSTMVNINDIFF